MMPQDSRPFKNSNLFSNHYLEKLVIANPVWLEATPQEAFAAIKELYQRKARALENYNEEIDLHEETKAFVVLKPG
jgi:hypothetical protein